MRPLTVLLASTLLAAAARAEDTDPPLITHEVLATAELNTVVTIRAEMEDESEIFAPTLYYRFGTKGGYSALAMSRDGGAFVASLRVPGHFDYWIEAYDEYGNGPARDGGPDRAHHVRAIEKQPEEPPPPPFVVLDPIEVGGTGPVAPVEPVYTQGWFLGTTGAIAAGVIAALVVGMQPEPVERNAFGASGAAPGR